MSEDVFRAFAEIAKHECEDYCILGDVDLYTDGRPTDLMDYEVIDVTLIFDDPDDYLSLKQMQHGKPYYVPKRAELLCYADPFYFEQSKEAAALRDFLVTGMSLEPDKADFLMVDIGYDARCGDLDFQKVMEWFEELGLVFQSDRDVMTFAGVYQAFQNNTRMRCNRGHTLANCMRCSRRRTVCRSPFLWGRTSVGPSRREAWMRKRCGGRSWRWNCPARRCGPAFSKN